MKIKQFYDDALAHASYAVVSEGEMALVDPARDPDPYLKYSREENVMITAVIETHPHADFVSSHKEISKITGAPVYVSRLLGADYPHETFDSGDFLRIGKVTLHAFNTPGHSPDSISIVVKDEHGKDHSVFTGDTLFIGDVGRPDLRENTGNITAKREELARQMYHSTRDILMKLGQDVVIYPAHGAGSLCGKAISRELSSTLGRQLRENYALQDMKEDDFVKVLLEDQPFIPKYFSFDVEMNKSGADEFEKNIKNVPRLKSGEKPESGTLVVDTRSKESFNMGHIPGSFHIIEDGKFETWLGAIVGPNEPYYLVGEDEKSIESIIRRAAKIGYEKMIRGALLNPDYGTEKSPTLDLRDFRTNPGKYTVVDVRNLSETRNNMVFSHAIKIPLYELRERAGEIPTDKPIVVHCAGGYRSAAAASIINKKTGVVPCFDLGENIKQFRAGVTSSFE